MHKIGLDKFCLNWI